MKRSDVPKLISEIQAGNETAFNTLYQEFHTAFFYMALKLTNNEADAQDAVQETFISIQKNIGALKNPNVAIVWMKQILINRCKNLFRKNRNVIMDEGTLAGLNIAEERMDYIPAEQMRQKSDEEVVLRLLANVPYIYREPLILKYYDGAKMSEIATILSIPEGTVKSRLRTGKQLLREQINYYESQTNERVPFHMFPVGLLLLLGFYKDASQASTFSSHGTLIMKVTCAILLTTGGAVLVSGILSDRQNQNAVQNVEEISELTERDAYFILRKKAHCKDELELMDSSQLSQLTPYVTLLQERAGVYYDLLCQDGWMEAYEHMLK